MTFVVARVQQVSVLSHWFVKDPTVSLSFGGIYKRKDGISVQWMSLADRYCVPPQSSGLKSVG